MRKRDGRVDTIAAALEESALLCIRRLLDTREMSLTASDVLHRLDSEGPARLSAITAATGLSQPSMTQLIQRLEQRGLISRSADPSDKRATLITISATGRKLVERRRQNMRNRLHELLNTLRPDERASLELAAEVALPLVARLSESDPASQPRRTSA